MPHVGVFRHCDWLIGRSALGSIVRRSPGKRVCEGESGFESYYTWHRYELESDQMK